MDEFRMTASLVHSAYDHMQSITDEIDCFW